MKIFDSIPKLLFAYALLIILSIIQLPAYTPAMRDFNLEVSLVFVILYLFKTNNNRLEYMISLIIFILLSIFTNEHLVEVVLDLIGFLLFTLLFKPHRLLRTIYIIVIVLTLIAYILVPIMLPDQISSVTSYYQIMLSASYIKYILTVFPAYLIFEWALNGFIIEYLIKKLKS